MKFKVEIEAEVADHDSDVMTLIPGLIRDRFSGTAVRVTAVTINKENR
jgi:hypothetical protein